MASLRKVSRIYRNAESHWVGNGFPVRTLFSYRTAEEFSPFLLLDYAAAQHFEAARERRGVDEHPHRGFETVTIVYAGELEHRDSSGNSGRIGPGDVQWMTAGSGVVHEEKHSAEFTASGGTMEMVQLWVNLPATDKMTTPRYQTLLNRDIPSVELANDVGTLRVIAGSYNEKKGPASTFTPINVWDVRLRSGSELQFDIQDGWTLCVAVLQGTLAVSDRDRADETEVVVFERRGEEVRLKAESDAKLLVLSGKPIEEPIAAYGPFVMNTEQELMQAFADYRSGRMGTLDPL